MSHNYVSCLMCGILFGLFIGVWTGVANMQRQAISHNAAQYTTDGSFEWLKSKGGE